jgi:membrane protein implicated in regulation of membrane protease activity
MAQLFLAALLLGILLGVFAMLAGVERRPRGTTPSPEAAGPLVSRESLMEASNAISARFHIPLIAAFATVFGAVGYLVSRYSSLGVAARIGIAGVAGALAAAGAITLIARWAIPSARRDIPDERYLWQGMLAQVTAPISSEIPGRITLEIDGTRHAVVARSLTGDAIGPGADVVIERIEGGMAFVEPWATVERRL